MRPIRVGILLALAVTLTGLVTAGDQAAAQAPVDQSSLLLVPGARTAPAPG